MGEQEEQMSTGRNPVKFGHYIHIPAGFSSELHGGNQPNEHLTVLPLL